MDIVTLNNIIKILSGIETEMVDRTLYLNNVKDANDLIKLKNAFINLEKYNRYKNEDKLILNISKYLENKEKCDLTIVDKNNWEISNIQDINIIHAVYIYKMLYKVSPNIKLNIKNTYKSIVKDIIKQHINKENFDYMTSSIKIEYFS